MQVTRKTAMEHKDKMYCMLPHQICLLVYIINQLPYYVLMQLILKAYLSAVNNAILRVAFIFKC